MERFSNSYQELKNQILQELHSFELQDDEYVMISYSERPWFPLDQFSITVIASTSNNQLKIVKQTWDNEYDLNRFASGIYNLDRLCIKKAYISLSSEKQTALVKIINAVVPHTGPLDKQNHIILDGIDYQLMFNTPGSSKKYEWKIASERIGPFNPLISFLLHATTGK